MTTDVVRIVHWGLGAMGAGMARLVQEKPGLCSVGAVARTAAKHGHDLGESIGLGRLLGVRVSPSFHEAVAATGAELALISTTSFTRDVAAEVLEAVEAGLDVITIAEEMAFAWRREPELAARVDEAARRKGVTVLGTGINPGFVLDTLIIALTGVCERVESIRATRVNDLSPFGPTVLRTQGVGATPAEFARGIADGSIVGHIGFPESMSLIAKALGWTLDEIREERHPIVSKTERQTPHVKVRPGMVAGCRQLGYGFSQGKLRIKLEHPQQVHPEAEGVETGDYIWIEGRPPVNLAIKPEIPGGVGTIAVAVNSIPAVVSARPGLVDMTELPVPRAIMGDVRSMLRR